MVLCEGKYTRGYVTVRHGRTRTVRRGVHAAGRRCGTPSEEDRVASTREWRQGTTQRVNGEQGPK